MKFGMLMVKLNHRLALLVCACWLLPLLLCACSLLAPKKSGPGNAKVLYENNFEKAELGKVPDDSKDLMVLDGAFAIKEEGGNKFLALPGAPLDTYGMLFGPTTNSERAVSVRVHGTA